MVIGSCWSYFPILYKVNWSYPLREEWVRSIHAYDVTLLLRQLLLCQYPFCWGFFWDIPPPPTMQVFTLHQRYGKRSEMAHSHFQVLPISISWYAVPVAEGSTCWLSLPKYLIITEAAFWEWWMMEAFWKTVQTFSCRGCRNFLWHIYFACISAEHGHYSNFGKEVTGGSTPPLLAKVCNHSGRHRKIFFGFLTTFLAWSSFICTRLQISLSKSREVTDHG